MSIPENSGTKSTKIVQYVRGKFISLLSYLVRSAASLAEKKALDLEINGVYSRLIQQI